MAPKKRVAKQGRRAASAEKATTPAGATPVEHTETQKTAPDVIAQQGHTLPVHHVKSATTGGRVVMISVTMTPYTNKASITYSDDARLQAVHHFLRHIYPSFEMRRADGQVELFVMSCERGDENNNPHVQGFYEILWVSAENNALVRGEKVWLKAMWAESTELPAPRVEIRVVRVQDRMYLIGYCYKDAGTNGSSNQTESCHTENKRLP